MNTFMKARSGVAVLFLTVATACGGKKKDPVVMHVLSVSGAGSGTITSTPAGISCTLTSGASSGTCSGSFVEGSSVSLTATAAFDWELTTWGGGCSGTSSCAVTMSAAQSRSVTFDRAGGPGLMKLSVTTTSPNTGGLLLTITGGTVSSATGLSGMQVRTISAGAQTRLLLRGNIAIGNVVDLQVTERKSNFSVSVQTAAAGSAGGYAVLNPASYQLAVVRP